MIFTYMNKRELIEMKWNAISVGYYGYYRTVFLFDTIVVVIVTLNHTMLRTYRADER